MWKFCAKRVLMLPLVALLLTSVSFLLLALAPGNPALNALGIAQNGIDPTRLAYYERAYGLNRPLAVQYWRYVINALHGNLGISLRTQQPVVSSLMSSFPITFELTLLAITLAIIFGILLGTLAAHYVDRPLDHILSTAVLGGLALPQFWLALLLIYGVGLHLHWLPIAGFVPISQGIVPNLEHLILPVIAVAVPPGAVVMRQVRGAMIEVSRREYITYANAKGLSQTRTLMRHALKNAMIPVVTVSGLQLASLLGGAVFVEVIFSLNGLGQLLINSIEYRDYSMVVGDVLFLALAVLLVNLITDIVYALLDPRIVYS
jgi:peptide/nickel transport system permease protein